MWMEIFQTGTHTSANGVTKTYTQDDLRSIADLYNGQTDHEAPLVIGHPEQNGPAYGWAKSLAPIGDRLYAFVDQVSDAVKEANRKGQYKKISVSLYDNGLLRHIGLLGATPPAVKGMEPVKFNDGDQDFHVFGQTEEPDDTVINAFREKVKSIFETLKKKLSPDVGLDFAAVEKEFGFTLDTVNLEEDNMTNEELDKKWTQQFEEYQTSMKTIIDAQAAEIVTLKSTIAEKDNTHAMEIKKLQFADNSTVFSAELDRFIADGKVLPAEKDSLIAEFADYQEADSRIAYGSDQKSLTMKFRERLAARTPVRPSRTPFATAEKVTGQSAKGLPAQFFAYADSVAPDHLALHEKIQEYAETHKVTYEQAAQMVTSG
jgi:hypothetical protein